MPFATSQSARADGTRAALCDAIDDEHHARATYRRVIETFGPVPPFVNILASEERHIAALKRQFDRFGWEPPADRWADAVRAPASMAEACRTGVAAEIANADLYRRIMAMTDDAEVLRVFDNLRRASQERHLPAFRRCAEGRAGAPGRAHGGGPGGRRRGRRAPE
ncbi:MAG TPA: DUF2202 domain-containing protein [Azospirillum sp.]|nr:DUF2202 domain-containing protein [Azospirillum sp.]